MATNIHVAGEGGGSASVHVNVTVRLQRHRNDGVTAPAPDTHQGVAVTIAHALGWSANDSGNDDLRKYSMCSLLLQVGKILGVRPSHAPSPRLSSIFDELLKKWRLRWNGAAIDNLSDIDAFDGQELVLCCGDYVQEAALSESTVDLLELIPSRYNVVTVQAAEALGDEIPGNQEKGGSAEKSPEADGDSDSVEDVTDMYRSERPRSSPEVIDLQDASSDDDSECCFWEYDAFGNIGRKGAHMSQHPSAAHSKASTNGDGRGEGIIDIESISSDSGDSSIEDVTDMMIAKREEEVQQMMKDAEEIEDSDEDSTGKGEGEAGKKRKRKSQPQSTAKRRRKKKAESPIEVHIDDDDIPTCPGAKIVDDAGNDEVDRGVKQRIVKLLNTGFHGESNEHEARNAMKLARRLMDRYNLDQAVLMQERGDGSLNAFPTNGDEASSLQGGIVTTQIRNRKRQKPLSSLPRWHDFLVQPVCLNFHVEAFKTVARSTPHRAGECSVTFYGIRTNAQLAAYAFKIASERIALMAAEYEPAKRGNLPTTRQVVETRTARLSYALGIVKGLERDVKEGLRKEEERRQSTLRKAQRAAKSGEAYHEDGLSDAEDIEAGGDASKVAEEKNGGPEDDEDRTSSESAEHALDKLERENSAHLALVDHHKKVASDVLKSKKIKVRSARKPKSISLNRKAYEKGVVDSKEIDLNRQAIRE